MEDTEKQKKGAGSPFAFILPGSYLHKLEHKAIHTAINPREQNKLTVVIKQAPSVAGGRKSSMTDSETATSKERRGRKTALVTDLL